MIYVPTEVVFYWIGLLLFAFLTMATLHSDGEDQSGDFKTAAIVAFGYPLVVPFLAACGMGITVGKWIHRMASDR